MEQTNFLFSVPPATRRRLQPPRALQAAHRQFARRLEPLMTGRFQVLFNDNSSTMISTRRKQGVLQVRLHHMFIEAPDAAVVVLSDEESRTGLVVEVIDQVRLAGAGRVALAAAEPEEQ